MENKIILGSANFEQKYGIKKNFIKKSEIKKIFSLATKYNVKTIDTSSLYQKSEKIIGSLNKNRFKVMSKISSPPKYIKKGNINKWIKYKTMNSLRNLKIKRFECLLLHNADCLLGKNGNAIYESVKGIKINGLTNGIGISIYDFNILNTILKRFKFDLIQLPFNVFDQRLLKSGLLKKLKKKKIKIHARSIFLQGILLLKNNQIPKKLKKFNKTWNIWQDWLKKNRYSPLQACLSFVLKQKEVDNFIVGLNNKNQFNQILKIKKTKNNFKLPNFNIQDKKLIDPRKWLY